jgi:hypothetical protein
VTGDHGPLHGRSDRRVYLSFEPHETGDLAARLADDLTARGFGISGASASGSFENAIGESEVVLAILSPEATRSEARLEEIAWARSGPTARPIVPVMAILCEVPLMIFRLQHVDMQGWRESAERYRAGFEELLKAIGAVPHAAS